MGKTIDLFEKPKKKRQWLMHVCDACSDGPGVQTVKYACARCGHETDWTKADSVTAAKRGIPCPSCNSDACDEVNHV